MGQWETYLKWAIVGGISIFAIYMLYSFAVKQGWMTAKTRRMKVAEMMARRR